MCEHIHCKCQGNYWIQNSIVNSIVCGRHLPATVKRFRDLTTGIHDTPSIIVKIRYPHPSDKGASIWR